MVFYGGSFSGSTATPARGELLPRCSATTRSALGQFKAIFDAGNRMTPGKVVAAYRIDETLRLGTSWAPRNYDTYFRYPDDDGRFDRAVMRCVGVGKCRHSHGGVMCPSYMATREEEHSTRGRSRLPVACAVAEPGWRAQHCLDRRRSLRCGGLSLVFR